LIATILVRDGTYGREIFVEGVRRAGFSVVESAPSKVDLVITWNRYGRYDEYCREQEQRGVPVIVTENGYFGKDFRGGPWYAWARGAHAGAGRWPQTNLEARWRALGAQALPLQRPRPGARSTALVLGQRSIGQRDVASPRGWEASVTSRLQSWGVLVKQRTHPGCLRGQRSAKPLEEDLREVDFAVTWNSGAAIKSMLLGKPVLYDFPHWVARRGALRLCKESVDVYSTADDDRLLGLMDAAAAQRNATEILDGSAIKEILEMS
jgi:hypothetical protein